MVRRSSVGRRKWSAMCGVMACTLIVGSVFAAAPQCDSSEKEVLMEKASRVGNLRTSVSGADMAPRVEGGVLTLAPEAILYSQLDNGSATQNATSQNFEAVYDAYDTMAADDFVVTGS